MRPGPQHGAPPPTADDLGAAPSIRARSTVVAVAVVALALLATALGVVSVLGRLVEQEAVAIATARAQDVAAQLVARGAVDDALQIEPATFASAVVQVLHEGTVVAASRSIADAPPLAEVTLSPGQVVITEATVRLGDADDDVSTAVAVGVGGVTGADTVLVIQSAEQGESTIAKVRLLLALAFPALLVPVAHVAYTQTGRALAPVEEIRRRTAGISGSDLSVRVPVPRTADEIARLATTMNEMLDRLDHAQRAQQQFASDASHELRSPLATVRAEIEIALRHPDRTDWERTARRVEAETVRMSTLVEDLLALARADDRGTPGHRVEVDLDDLAGAEVLRLRALGITVEATVEPVRTVGDPAQLARVLRNLTDNAVRHHRSRIAVRVRRDVRGGAALEVADDGDGVPPADRERVFDRFVRLDAGRTRGAGGSGLGLAIVREIVRGHGGTVEVDADQVLGGAVLRVTIPHGPVPR